MNRHESAREHSASSDGQIGTDEAERSDVHGNPSAAVVCVPHLEARTDFVQTQDGTRERGKLEDCSHTCTMTVDVDAAGHGSDLERSNGLLDKIENPGVWHERVPVGHNGDSFAGVFADDRS